MQTLSTKAITDDFIALIFPEYCKVCRQTLHRGEKHICTPCLFTLPKNTAAMFTDAAAEMKFRGKIKVKHVFTYLQYKKNNPTQKLLYNVKYKNDQTLGHLMGYWFGTELRAYRFHQAFDLVIPVPLHPKKKKKRGYNQSAVIAAGLAEALQTPMADEKVLVKTRDTESQTRKSRYNRWLNAENQYQVAQPQHVNDKSVLLVDDTLTTGSTLEAAGNELLHAGVRELNLAALANAT